MMRDLIPGILLGCMLAAGLFLFRDAPQLGARAPESLSLMKKPAMEFLLADEVNEEADEITKMERNPPPGAVPEQIAKLQACRAYHIFQIAEFLRQNCHLSPDAKNGLAHRMERALWIAKPFGTRNIGEVTSLIARIAGE